MTLTPVKTPWVIKKGFPNYVWDIPATEKAIYLTFDDGPTPEITPWVLDILRAYHAKATFFCIGNNIEKYPNIFLDIIKEGHHIGNHTYNHLKGWKTKAEDYVTNIKKAQRVIDDHMSNSQSKVHSSLNSQTPNDHSEIVSCESPTPNLFRPPYGQITSRQGKTLIALGYKIIMWDVLSFDWDKNISGTACLKNVTAKTSKGSIVVFHDSIKASNNMQYALPEVLDFFSNKGYSFKAIPYN